MHSNAKYGSCWNNLFCLLVVVILVLTPLASTSLSTLTSAETATTIVPSTNCTKCSNGNSLTSLIVKEPNHVNCTSGHYFAFLIPDSGCVCEFLCARTSGQPCRSSAALNSITGQNQSLCDSTLRLSCNDNSNLCQGPLSLRTSNIGTNSFRIYWRGHGPSNQSTLFLAEWGLNFSDDKFVEKRPLVIHPYGHGQFTSEVRVPKDNTTYIIRMVNRDPHHSGGREELALVQTLPHPPAVGVDKPKILITHRGVDSLSIAFDDFKQSSGSQQQYKISYRTNNQSWTSIQSSSPTPFYKLTKLQPKTNYQVQVSLDNLSTDMINGTTMDGCVHGADGKAYVVNEKINEDCDRSCVCLGANQVDCKSR